MTLHNYNKTVNLHTYVKKLDEIRRFLEKMEDFRARDEMDGLKVNIYWK